MSIKVLIVDDQAMIRSGFTALLNAQADITVVGDAADGAAAVELAAQTNPDVVLMDVRMPVLDGIAATAQILDQLPQAKVLVLTTFDLDDYVLSALRAGASGFLLKDATAEELTHAVRVVARGDGLLDPAVTKRLIADLAARPAAGPTREGELETLTTRERETLGLIAQGLSNAEIAGKLFITEQTVKTHVSHVLAKLNLRDRAQAVVVAYETGLVVPGR